MTARYPKAVLGVTSGVTLETEPEEGAHEKEEEYDEDEEGEGYQEVAGEDVFFQCTSCGYQTDTAATQTLLNAEDRLCLDPPETTEQLTAFLAAQETAVGSGEAGAMFHRQHYMCFWLMDDIAMTLALDGQEVNPRSAHSQAKIRSSISLVKQLIALLESNPGVPSPHPEEIIFVDRLAQLYVMVGETKQAQRQYQRAYRLSCVCAGSMAASTLELKVLVDNTPATPAALMVRDALHMNSGR